MTVDRVAGTVSIQHAANPSSVLDLLRRLASSLRSQSTPKLAGLLPSYRSATRFSIHRHGVMLTSWEVLHDEPGWLRLRHEALRGDEALAGRIEREFRALPGIAIVKAGGQTGHLLIRYDPSLFAAPRLLGLAESTLREPVGRSSGASTLPPVKFGMANLSLGIAAVGEFLLPVLLPVEAVLLVLTNIRTFREAMRQLEKKQLGLAVLYVAIVATTLLTGQFLASALMTWCFRYWHRQFRVELASEQIRLLNDSRKDAGKARLLTPSGAEVLVEVGRVKPGDRVIVAADETVPADGRVVAGEGVVDERGVRGREGISRKGAGDAILAGSTVLAGSVPPVEVSRVGEQTRTASIHRALIAATSPAARFAGPDLTLREIRLQGRGPDPRHGGSRPALGRPHDGRCHPSTRLRDRPRPGGSARNAPQRRPMRQARDRGPRPGGPGTTGRGEPLRPPGSPHARPDRAGRGQDRDPFARGDPASLCRQYLPPPGRRSGDGPPGRFATLGGFRCSSSTPSISAGGSR